MRVGSQLPLGDETFFHLVDELDRILNGQNVPLEVAIDEVNHGCQGSRLSGTCRARHQNQPLFSLTEVLHNFRHGQLFQRKNRRRNGPENRALAFPLQIDIDTEASDVPHLKGEIAFMTFEEDHECDFSFEMGDVARFRVNVYLQRKGEGAVFRTIPTTILTLEQLAMPKIMKDLCQREKGLVLVTGPTGSGKSTTLAAMIDFVNGDFEGHILTVEDPIEFVHKSKKCLINQRELGAHTHSFANALRAALREDPDCILVGELRDLETIRLALTAAETGHLVFGTLHTSSAAKTVDRIVDVFPAAEKDMVRAMLSESLRAVISQTLLKKKGGGRVAAHEIMIGTPAIRNLIRENKIAQMYSAIQTGQQFGK